MMLYHELLLLRILSLTYAVQLKCGDGAHSMEVVENTKDFTLTCDGYDHGSTVYWQRKSISFAQLAIIGSCNSTTCTIAPGFPVDKVSLTYVSSNSSRLTSTYTARKDDGVTYYCHNEMCKVHIVSIQLKCGDEAHSMEVVENTKDFTLSCDGYDHGSTVYWQRKSIGFAHLAIIGSCNSTTCTIAPGFPVDKVSLTYVSWNSSRLTSTYTARKDDGITYYCHKQTCKVHIVYNLETIRDDLKKKENPQLQSEDVANLVSKVEQNLGGNATVSTSNETKVVVDILNELFQTSTEELKTAESTNGSASRLLGMVETLLTKVELTNDQFQTTSTQLFVAVRQNVTSGLTLTAYDKDFNGNFEGDEVKIDFNSEVPKEESVNSLVLPDSLFTNNNLSSSRIILVSYLSDNLYEVVRQAHAGNQTKAPKDTSYVRKINSHVLAASIIGSNFILTDPIVITLVHHEKNSKNATCVFWNDTQKDWSTKGCELDSSSSTQFRSSCRCDHLTSFALLMDVYQEGESSSVLSALSIIGCCVSLSSLLITIITYGILIALGDKRPCLKERREQRDVPHKILLNLCSALVLSNVVYLTGWIEHIPKPPVVCKVAAAMLHFFLLGAFCWMAVEAYYMYLVLVQVFKTNFTNFALKCSIFGWGVPLLVVAITLGVNKTDNYQNIQDNVCWLKGIAFYVAFVTPVCLVLVMNFAIFGLVLRRMMGLSGNKSISGPSFTVKRQLRGAIGVIILLGLTWIFAFLNTNKASPVFAYLFVIFNPLQGTFIFLYYCIMREDIRVIWLRWLYCGQADVIVISNQEDFTSRNAEQEHEKHPENSGKYQVLEEASTNRILQKANSKKNKRPGSKLAVDTSKTTMTTVSESIADSEI